MDRMCPLLALAADNRTVVDGVDPGHRCHATDDPRPLERQEQANLCLTPRHDHCQRYLQHVARRGAAPGAASVAGGLVSTRMRLAPEPAWRGIAGRARGARSGRAIGMSSAILGVGLVAALLAGPALSGDLTVLNAGVPVPGVAQPDAAPGAKAPSATPQPTSSATAGATASATARATPAPTPEPTPTAIATAAPTASPTPASPAPTPAPPRTYVVQQGDTLAEIAAAFGTTVQALQAANDIDDPDEIGTGDLLVIP